MNASQTKMQRALTMTAGQAKWQFKSPASVPAVGADAPSRWMLLSLVLIVLLGLLIRLYPAALGEFGCPDAYFHLRMSEAVAASGSLPEYDALSMQGRYYSYAPLFHTIFAVFQLFSGLEMRLLIEIMPALYGAASICVIFALARRLFGTRAAIFSALALAIMPMSIIRTSSYARPDGLALLIVPTVVYLFCTRRTKLAALLSAGLVLLHPLSTLYLLAFLLLWALLSKRLGAEFPRRAALLAAVATVAVFALWLFSLPYPPAEYISGTSFESSELARPEVLVLISLFPFSWIFVLLALFKLRGFIFEKFWLLYSFVFAVWGLRLGIFMSLPMAIFAGFGIETAWEKTKAYSKVFLALLFLLAAVVVLPKLALQSPWLQQSERSAMVWLSESTDSNATIAALWDRGHPLTYYAQRQVVLDGYFEFAPGLEERNAAVKDLLTTSDCGKIKADAALYNMDYVFIHKAALNELGYLNGILEAKDCQGLSAVFASDGARVLKIAR